MVILGTITVDTRRKLQRLPRETLARVEAVVRRHLHACAAIGAAVENINGVWMEAIELVEKGQDEEEPREAMEPPRRYEQYRSPRSL